MPVVRTNDIESYYLEHGAGDPVVFIHGHTLDHRMWDAQVDALTGASYRVVRYDLRGHGRSEAPPTGYSTEELASDLKALLDNLDIERAHIVGLSRGGGVALAFVLAYPGMTRTVTFIDSILPGRAMGDDISVPLREVNRRWREQGRVAFEEAWLTSELLAPARRDPILAVQLEAMVRSYSGAEMSAPPPAPRSATPATPLADRLSEVRAPALVIVGELDLPSFHASAQEMARAIPDARMRLIADAGHMANMERPEAVNAALLEFLKDR
jgi:pimeloyl-ACP methyl ester carboxylesterase